MTVRCSAVVGDGDGALEDGNPPGYDVSHGDEPGDGPPSDGASSGDELDGASHGVVPWDGGPDDGVSGKDRLNDIRPRVGALSDVTLNWMAAGVRARNGNALVGIASGVGPVIGVSANAVSPRAVALADIPLATTAPPAIPTDLDPPPGIPSEVVAPGGGASEVVALRADGLGRVPDDGAVDDDVARWIAVGSGAPSGGTLADGVRDEVPAARGPLDVAVVGSSAPGSEWPWSDRPGSGAPASDPPGSDAPGSDAPASEELAGWELGVDGPRSDGFGSEELAGWKLGVDGPGTGRPGADGPGTDGPGSDGSGREGSSDGALRLVGIACPGADSVGLAPRVSLDEDARDGGISVVGARWTVTSGASRSMVDGRNRSALGSGTPATSAGPAGGDSTGTIGTTGPTGPTGPIAGPCASIVDPAGSVKGGFHARGSPRPSRRVGWALADVR